MSTLLPEPLWMENNNDMHLQVIKAYLKGLQEGIEVDEDDLRDLVLPWVYEEQHVRDTEQRQQHECGLHRLPTDIYHQ